MRSQAEADAYGKKYAAVLERMVEILAPHTEGVTFGAALTQASQDTGIPVPPEDQETLLIVAFQIIGTGKLPGAPEA